MLVFGILFAFLGNRLFRLVMFLTGFVYLGLGVLLLCIRIHPPGTSVGHIIGYLVTSGVFGLIGGALFAAIWWLGLAGVGSLGGLAIAAVILSFKNGALITNPIGRGFFIAGMIVLAIVLIFVLEKWIVILSTAFFGSLATFIGLDCFFKTGFRFILYLVVTAKADKLLYETNGKVYGMIGGMLGLIIIACVVQYMVYKEPIGIREYNLDWVPGRKRKAQEKILTEPEMQA
ncbi:hypothetical protein BJ085DRAFT_30036 [Dimargaris cristalligena]|uniref:Transmembrane protein 198 n=1 Tax=Dimargaris cristalligena TaxID=215637 RepID=A0A4P9ZXN3_9FUNG|nr:hypothetical protein BJ085DRAFT_30036 [Dimargaris cristalligena]|eukprot:RKP38426.1 hypothetical protein BJ085DRAFT_30036 [Dimargaris cristalligena]